MVDAGVILNKCCDITLTMTAEHRTIYSGVIITRYSYKHVIHMLSIELCYMRAFLCLEPELCCCLVTMEEASSIGPCFLCFLVLSSLSLYCL